MAVADQIMAHLERTADDLPTAKEIAEAIGANPSTVSTSLKRLAYLGKVRQVGEAMGGGKTWAVPREGGA